MSCPAHSGDWNSSRARGSAQRHPSFDLDPDGVACRSWLGGWFGQRIRTKPFAYRHALRSPAIGSSDLRGSQLAARGSGCFGSLLARSPSSQSRSRQGAALRVKHRPITEQKHCVRARNKPASSFVYTPVAFPHKMCYLAVGITQEGAWPIRNSICCRALWT